MLGFGLERLVSTPTWCLATVLCRSQKPSSRSLEVNILRRACPLAGSSPYRKSGNVMKGKCIRLEADVQCRCERAGALPISRLDLPGRTAQCDRDRMAETRTRGSVKRCLARTRRRQGAAE